jgi:peptide/nickel transport system substrate-binding protein
MSRLSGWKRAAPCAVVVAMAVMVAACSGGSSTSSSAGSTSTGSTDATGVPQHGGSAVVIGPVDANTLDPATAFNEWETGGEVLSAIYDSLFTVGPTGNIQPYLAQNFTTTDGITWTLTLRPGVKFTDGTPFNAAAVKAEWLRIENPKTPGVNAQYLQPVKSMTVVNDLTLSIKLNAVNYQFDQAVATSALTWIPSPTAVAKYGANYGNHPVGAGPYELSSITPSVQTVLTRNPDYWQKGLPYLNQITFKFNPDEQQSIEAVETGEAQMTAPVDVLIQKTAKQANLDVTTMPISGVFGYFFNQSKAPFNNVLAREAVYDAINEQTVNEQVFDGLISAPSSVVATSSPLFDPSSTFAPPNSARAQQLFNQLAAEGKPVSFTFPYDDTTIQREAATAIETQLAAYKNVSVQIEPENAVNYTQFVEDGNYGLIELGLFGSDPEPIIYDALHTGGGANFGHVSNPAIDAATQAGRSTPSLTARQAAYASLVQALNKNYVALWALSPSSEDGSAAYSPTFNAPVLYGDGTALWDTWGQLAK